MVTKMILKYQSGAKTRTNERHDETPKGEGKDTANKPDDFLRLV